jgi:tight adherence protein C
MFFVGFIINFVASVMLLKGSGRIDVLGATPKNIRSKVQEQIEMADFCDLLALSLEAGNNLGLAFASAHSVLLSPVGLAFARGVKGQLACGVSVSDAFQKAAEHEKYEAAAELSASLVLAIRVGNGAALATRRFAQDLRSRAASTLEERAARVPVLMLFPLAVFILPVVCVLLTAGAVAEFLRTLV